MNLNEMFEPAPEHYQDVEDDNSVPKYDDLRKSRLTLLQINKLRRMQDLRAFEQEQKLDSIKQQYSQSDGSESVEL
jgi:hypothetical protein